MTRTIAERPDRETIEALGVVRRTFTAMPPGH